VPEAGDRVAVVLETRRRLPVALLHIVVVVWRAVHEDDEVVSRVDEVRLHAEPIDPLLCVGRELKLVLFEEVEKAALESRVAAGAELLKVDVAR
jgi:hypothetical protein